MSKKRKRKNRKKAPPRERIALCMIVKNEEANLERCLKSVRGLVSEINIVDTGSTDGTVSIAKRLGARVRRLEWNDDFGRARNVSLQMAAATWILVLDADEVLAPDAIKKIKAAVRNPNISGYDIPTRNYTNDSSSGNFIPNDYGFEPAHNCDGWVESRKVRLFKNLPGICFEGEIHEVVGPSIRRSGKKTEPLDVIVHHFGHLASDGSLKKKAEMMARLAEAKCANRPGDYKAHYELGVIAADLRDFGKAEQSFRKSIELRDDFALAHYDLGVVLSMAGREEEAAEHLAAAVRLDPDNADAMNNLADSLQRLRRDAEAERVYRKLLDTRPDYKRSWNNLGALLASTGRLEEAGEAFKKALDIDPNFLDARGNLEKLRQLKPRNSAGKSPLRKPSGLLPGISLCMIVKNEEENLPVALAGVRAAVDEIVVVDTGSTDNTRAVAASMGATVLDFEWVDDFAAARNFSLSGATREWILVIDADETPGDAAALKALIARDDAVGFSFETRNYSRDSSLEGWRPVTEGDEAARSFPGWFSSEKVRLFRNSPNIRFEGRVHELVEPSIRRFGGEIERASVPIHHYGYDRAPEKAGAYLGPAAEKARANPESAGAHYELGAVLNKLERFDEAGRSLARAVELAPGQAEYLVALGDSLRAAGRAAEAETAYRSAVAARPGLSQAHRGLGITLFRQGNLVESLAAFEVAVGLCPHDAQSITNIGVINAQIGNLDEAAGCFSRALKINPSNAVARNNLDILSARTPATTDRHGPPTLGLLMIVKDEQENLEEMLLPLAPCFDEIVVVDTGSTDDTRAVAESVGARVFDFDWIDDFSAARNFGLARAGADWLIWLDADDRLDPEAVASIREHLSDAQKAFLLRVVSGANGCGEFLQLRLFPNSGGIAWEGRVHEQIFPSIKRRNLTVETLPEIAITHTGYEDADTMKKKSRRNAALLEKDRAIRPDDPYVLQHLAQAYGVLGEIDRAVEASEALVNANNPETPAEFLSHTMNRLVQYGLIRNDLDAATLWADRLLDTEPDNRLVRYFLGEIRYRRGQAREAVDLFERFLDADEVIGCVPVPWKTLEANAHNFLGLLFEQAERRDRARKEFRRAMEGGARVEAHNNLARILMEDGRTAEAATVLEAAAEIMPGDPFVWANLGAALGRSGRFGEAADACRRALDIDPQNSAARQNLQRIEEKLDGSPRRTGRLSLSACMIVKNEAARLKDAIESIAPMCDEIIVVDTGSTDDTIEIARSCGARVETFEWNDDFAAARNFALELARREWVFILDADEIIDTMMMKEIAALEPGPEVWGYSITTRNYCVYRQALGWRPAGPSDEHARGLPGWLPSAKVRLFRNLPEIRFEGRIHEVVEPSILAAGKSIGRVEAPVHHYGYNDSDKAGRRRYLDMAGQRARENPADPCARLELGIQHIVAGDNESAETELSEAVSLDPTNELASLNLGGVRIMLGKLAEARQTLEKAAAANPGSAPLRHTLGIALEKMNRPDDAEAVYLEALALDPDDSVTLAALGRLSVEKGEMHAAEDYLKRALKVDPSDESALNNLEYVRRKMTEPPRRGSNGDGNGDTLQKNLENLNTLAKELAERPNDPRVIEELAQTFRACGQTEHAEKWMETLRSMQT